MPTNEILPSANGDISASGWAASGAATLWDCVNDPVASPDDATTIIYNTAAAKYALFTGSFSVPANAVIDYVRIVLRATHPSGTAQLRARLKIGGTYYDSSDSTIATSYTNYTKDFTTNPRTGAAWTVNDVNGTGSDPLQQFGVYNNAAPGANVIVTQIYCVVSYALPEPYAFCGQCGWNNKKHSMVG